MKKTGLVLLICLFASYSMAGNTMNFQQMLNERDIIGIENVLKIEPENAEANYFASLYYNIGDDELGTNKDEVKQLAYLKKSANLAFPEAQLQYGFTLLNKGRSEEGLSYIVKAADSDYLPALTLLGDLYFAGYQDLDGLPVIDPDIENAIKYLEQAVAKNDQDARYTLGHIYLSSDFGKKNINKALELFEANIDYDKKIGHLPSLIALIDFYEESDIAIDNQSKLLDCYYIASLQGYQSAFYIVGMLQKEGAQGKKIIIHKDPEAAFVNLEKAAKLGYVDAMFRVGEMYFKGEGAQQSDMNAYIWMAIAEDLSGNKTNYSETILELIPKRQRQIAMDNKNHYRQFFSMSKTEDSASKADEK